MRIFRPLRNRSIALLWSGQVLSSVGDELHKVAFIWLVAGILGNDTGYVAAIQAASVFLLSVFGGIWADGWNHRKTMIGVDVIRGLTVLAIPISAMFGRSNLLVLLPVAIIVSGLNALFSPALRAVIPEIAQDQRLLHETNGLMETTGRFARILGPGLVGIMSKLVPLVQFFSLDALSFFVSAASLASIGGSSSQVVAPATDSPLRKSAFEDGILGGWRALRRHAVLRFIVLGNSVVNAAWYLVYPLALGLYLHEKMPNDVGALGLVIAAYGVGNVLSNIVAGSFQMEHPALFAWAGRMACGFGFVGLALAPSLSWMMVASALAATGGPMTDLSFLALLQRSYKSREIAKIFRLDMAITYGTLLICYASSPALFRMAKYPTVIGACGFAMIAIAMTGYLLYREGPAPGVDFESEQTEFASAARFATYCDQPR